MLISDSDVAHRLLWITLSIPEKSSRPLGLIRSFRGCSAGTRDRYVMVGGC